MNKKRTVLNPRDKKYIAARVKGMKKREAALEAGLPTPIAADKYAERASKNVVIQEAIDKALDHLGASPEFAVGNVKKIAEDTEENATAALNANRLILELHGWNKADRPSVTVQVKNAFFAGSRKRQAEDNTIIDQ